jgi:hypothetical protein
MLWIAMTRVVLDEAQVIALVGKVKAGRFQPGKSNSAGFMALLTLRFMKSSSANRVAVAFTRLNVLPSLLHCLGRETQNCTYPKGGRLASCTLANMAASRAKLGVDYAADTMAAVMAMAARTVRMEYFPQQTASTVSSIAIDV